MAKRIAQMLYSMGMGGVENFLMNIYRNIDREKYQFDFILQTTERSYFDNEVEKLGGRIFRMSILLFIGIQQVAQFLWIYLWPKSVA